MVVNVEVQALITFGRFTAGKIYLLDLDDPHYPPLVAAGYLRVTNTFVEVTSELETSTDSAGMGSVPVSGVVAGKKKRGKAVTGGEGEHLSAENERIQHPGDDAAGTQDS